jgi:sulfide dehydrogenase [flavocytochrome c] flavoprotein subunit
MDRRDFLELLAAGGMAAAMAPLAVTSAQAAAKGRVVVVGGGFGGATCANYLKRYGPGLQVTLIEPNKVYHTCPFSNTVLGGINKMDFIQHSYDNLGKKRGVEIVHDRVTAIDAARHSLTLASGKTLSYDRLVVSPGIDFRWQAIEGYSEALSSKVPHAWQAGAQTQLLLKQLQSMRNGGLVIIAPPDNPFRCPPGPYERAAMIAHYLKQHKPKSKILILDAKDKFSKQPLFEEGWQAVYPGMIEWVKGSAGGKVERIDVSKKTLHTMMGDKHKGDVINLIPPQKAGAIAHQAGLTNADGWCPVDKGTFVSTLHKDIHVIGDAAIANALPKSGFAASAQAKVCAAAIVSELSGKPMPAPTYANTCYSLIDPDYAVSVAAVYRFEGGDIKSVSSGVSPKGADKDFHKNEARFAYGWYQAITSEAFVG